MPLTLRPYQADAIDLTFDWMNQNAGNPCLVIPCGGGKTVIIAEFVRRVMEWQGMRVLLLTHVAELVEQAADTMGAHWPNCPLGVYAAGLNKRQLGRPVTFASMQSVRTRAAELGHIDLCLVDEAHAINHEDAGTYRQLLSELSTINPALRVVGLSGTPYRLGHGLITEGEALFSKLIEPVSIEQLVLQGWLAPLRSKLTGLKYDTSGVKMRGGDFVEADLAREVDTEHNNAEVVQEMIGYAGDRRRWMVFCTGVMHAAHMRDTLSVYGVPAKLVTGKTPRAQRAEIVKWFKAPGEDVRCLVSVNTLTTGFDAPDVDLIGMCRPTLSPGLYYQAVARGMRLKSHTDHCLVLDFAGVVERHGPITAIETPEARGKGRGGEPQAKVCDSCHELVATSCKQCPACGEPFPEPEKAPLALRDDNIMGDEPQTFDLESWRWKVHESKKSGLEMLRIDYEGTAFNDPQVSEYLCLRHDGYAKQKADRTLATYAEKRGLVVSGGDELGAICELFNSKPPPREITVKKDGKFWRIIGMNWAEPDIEEAPKIEILEGDVTTWEEKQTEIPF